MQRTQNGSLCPGTKIAHGTGQLNPRSTITEVFTPWNLCSATREATAVRSPSTATRARPWAAVETQSRQIDGWMNEWIFKIIKEKRKVWDQKWKRHHERGGRSHAYSLLPLLCSRSTAGWWRCIFACMVGQSPLSSRTSISSLQVTSRQYSLPFWPSPKCLGRVWPNGSEVDPEDWSLIWMEACSQRLWVWQSTTY